MKKLFFVLAALVAFTFTVQAADSPVKTVPALEQVVENANAVIIAENNALLDEATMARMGATVYAPEVALIPGWCQWQSKGYTITYMWQGASGQRIITDSNGTVVSYAQIDGAVAREICNQR